jgi:predicted PurR-regulated permease PerM
MTGRQGWLTGAAVAAVLLVLYILAPVLTPFLFALLLAYMGDPLVDRLEARGFQRSRAVLLVFVLILLVLIPLPLLLIPLLEGQLALLLRKVPGYFEWLQASLGPWLHARLGVDAPLFDAVQIRDALAQHWKEMGGIAASLVATLSRSGFVIVGLLANVLLIPVVTFYLLRDWDVMLQRLRMLLPRKVEPQVVGLAGECDAVLGAFMRGQLMVMAALGTVYTVGLLLVGLDFALLIGMAAGLVSFVPYLGFIVGCLAAAVAAVLQYHDLLHVLLVGVVFAAGQVLESFVLTPMLVGDRIGLHPVVVIFAVMLGGHLFGFFGVLLALPAAAVVLVLLRHVHAGYTRSSWYGETPPSDQGQAP